MKMSVYIVMVFKIMSSNTWYSNLEYPIGSR